jgi:hypothetical protein
MRISDIKLWTGIVLSLLLLSSCNVKDLGLDSVLGGGKSERGIGVNATPVNQTNFQTSQPTQGNEKRVALVVGNGAYRHVDKLKNPPNDAQSLKSALLQLGFTVIHEENLSKEGIERSLQEFAQELQGASLGLFFYAGHGGRHQRENFLISVNANFKNRGKALENELVALDSVLKVMEQANVPTKIIILDACRNNPFSDKGLAEVKPQASYNGGTFIAYSTQPGNVAEDGEGYNSPYAESLLKLIHQPNKPIEVLFRNVRTEVKRKTQGRQIPWDESSLEGGDLCFAGCFASEGKTENDYCTTKLGSGLYQGQCQNNLPHGKGVMRYTTGEYYEGRFENGLRNGQGIQYLTDGTEMEGQFCNGRICN